MKFYKTVNSPIGILSICSENDFITDLHIGKTSNSEITDIPILNLAALQLEEYFSLKRKSFELPIKFSGTDFQNRVWSELCKIPYGDVVSYKKLAERIGNPKAYRAVGMAANKNPLPIIIPCHRVIGSDGNMTGYAYGLHIKKLLLELESPNKQQKMQLT